MKKIFVCALALSGLLAEEVKHVKPSYDADLYSKDRKTIFTNLEFLYWAVDENFLDYAIKMKHPAWASTNVYANGSMKNAHIGWDPGFRINVGYFNAPHYWDAYLQYTYLRNNGHAHASKPTATNEFLNGTWPQPDPTGTVALEHADSKIDFHYNVLDVMATRRFYPNPHFRMRLAGGATVAWIRQEWQTEYTDLHNNKSHINNHWRFTGAGFRTGLILDWYLGKWNIYITGSAGAAVLAGQYHNVSKQTTTYAATGFNPEIPIRNMHYSNTRLTLEGQFSGGPSWQMAFKSFRTELFLGYELTVWSNLHEVFRSTSGVPQAPKETWQSNGLLTMQGPTIRLNLDF